ncbi:hypothetical protein KMT30_31490 [Streptomyces sp. IBSBF 2953]|nr:hypothetical protein [Streptomyces hayashii]
MRRAVRPAAESPAAEPFAADAIASITDAVAMVIVLALTGMVAQFFPEPRRNRTADTEGHGKRLTRSNETGEGSCEGRGAP